MSDIFLSYSREDQATARRFAQALEAEGFSVWWDQTLHSGDPYDRMTEQALKDAKAAVVLWSPYSVESRWVRAEATMADRRGTLVPVMIQDCDRPLMFELTQAAELMRWKGDRTDPVWRAFVDDVRRYLSRDHAAPGAGIPPASTPPMQLAPARRKKLLAGLAVLLILAASWVLFTTMGGRGSSLVGGKPVSIAVLPFNDMTGKGLDEGLAEGLSDEISNWLAQIPGLKVVARTSSFQYRGTSHDVRKIGRELSVTHVLEGSVRRGGKTVRVTVQLVACDTGFHLWSRTYDLPDGDALQIEDAVSRSVAETLNAGLTDETERRWKARRAQVPEAYALYLEGRAEQRRITTENNLRAMEQYRKAIAADREFAPSYVGLAEASLNSVSLNGRALADVAPEVLTLLDEADRVSPNMPEAIAARGWLAMEQYREQDALELMQRAVEMNPNDADTQRRLGTLYARMARPRLAAERYSLAASLDPLDAVTRVRHCMVLQDLAEFVAAEAACAKARDLDSNSVWGPLATGWLEFTRGDLASSITWLDRAMAISPGFTALQVQRVPLLLQLERVAEARQAAASLPATEAPQRTYLEGLIALDQGDDALAGQLEWLETHTTGMDMTQLLDLANLQLAAGRGQGAQSTLSKAMGSRDWQVAALTDPENVRFGYAGAAIVAAIQMDAGNRELAIAMLDALDGMLDRLETGGAACSGVYSLRAESNALRGQPELAVQFLQKALERGWRQSRAARTLPSLRSLRDRKDFQQLLARADRSAASTERAAR